MSIRSAAKAIIVKDGQILLNRCRHKDGSIYYDLPGGGQHQYESCVEAAFQCTNHTQNAAEQVCGCDCIGYVLDNSHVKSTLVPGTI